MKSRLLWGVATVVLLSAIFSLIRIGHPGSSRELFAQASDNSPEATLHPVTTFTVGSDAPTITAAFIQANQPYYPEDQVTAFPDPTLHIGSVVTVHRALPVTVADGKKSTVVRTWQGTVGDLLAEKKIDLGNDDKISPVLSTPLSTDTKVVITRVARTNVTETSDVPFQTVTQLDYSQFVGSQTVTQQGSDGQIQRTYLLVRQDGELVSKTLISSTTTKAPQNQIVKAGGLETAINTHTSCPQYIKEVVAAGARYGINPNSLFNSMIAESNCHYNSVASAGYSGLFQYDPGWWPSAAAQAGFAGASVFDTHAQIYTTAYQWAHGQCRRWPTCSL